MLDIAQAEVDAAAIPLDLFKSEQATIASAITVIDGQLDVHRSSERGLSDDLDATLSLARNCYEAYRCHTPQRRRMINQAVFERLYIHADVEVDGELREPFDTLLGPETLDAASS